MRICIVLDKMERTETIPDEVAELFKGRTLASVEKGCDYVILHLTVSKIKQVHVTKMMCGGSGLIDDEGHECRPIGLIFRGWKFRDPHDIKSESELVPGSTGILIYEIPVEAKPATLKLIYSYLESWEEKDTKYEQIDIEIPT